MSAEAFRSRIGSALANRDYTEVEAAWREYASAHPEDWEYHVQTAGQLTRYDKGGLAGELCLTLAQSLLDSEKGEPALEVGRAALKGSQRTEGLREFLGLAYRQVHADNEHVETFVQKAGLDEEGSGLRQQVETLDRYLAFAEGVYVFHAGGWGYGEVVEFDADDETMVVDFERKKGHLIKLVNAPKILQRLTNEHIGVYMHFRRDELDQLLENDPAKVFHLYLDSMGGKATLKQVRETLVPQVLEKAAWTRWWGRAKKALLKDPEIRIGKGSSPLLEMRDKAKSIEQEVADRMAARERGLEKCAVAREYLRTLDLTPELADKVGEQVVAALATEAAGSPAHLALLYLKADLKADGSEEAAAEAAKLVSNAEDAPDLLAPLEPADRKRAVQDLHREGGPGAASKLTDLLRAGDADIADTILDLLKPTRPDVLIGFFAELTTNPRQNPALFLWYVRGFLHGSIPVELAPGEKGATVMEKLLTLANQIGLEQRRSGDADLKSFLRQVRSFLTSRRLKTFKEFVAATSLDYARFLFAKIQRNRGFTDQTKTALLDVIESEHPDIHTAADAQEEEESVVPSADVIWTTLGAYHDKEAELRHVVEVEVPQNAEDLGRAASFGDISENAEYSAALEKQDRLMRKVRELREALDKARILEPELITTERVVIGTRVQLKDTAKGEETNFSILGPWDVDLDKGIISYLSPVGRGLLGKTVGATAKIELPDKGEISYEVLAIRPEESIFQTD